jgi:Cu/Ag efflux pump CusA
VNGYVGVDAEVTTFLRSRFGKPLTEHDEPIVVRLFGQEQDVQNAEAAKLKQAMSAIPGIAELDIEMATEEPVVEILVDLEKAKNYGVKPGDVRRAAAMMLSGIEVGNLFEEQKVFEVVVWGTPQVRHSVDHIQDLLIDTPGRGHVRLGDVASVRMSSAPSIIRRENVARTMDIVAAVRGRSVGAVAADVRNQIRQSHFPIEYRAELLGGYARMETARARFMAALIAVAIGILFVLQAVLGSWALAFTLLLTLPVALAGGVIAAAASGVTLSFAAMGGLLAVLGIAVRQGVLMISRYRELRLHEGRTFGPELIREGTRDQAPAILMTALVTAAAVLPFAVYGARAGHEALGPLAVVILGGLATTLLYTLGIVPALYARFGAGAMSDVVTDEDLGISA